ncbi:hypothetical protein CDAR_601381 [Caerostris darwini]|uniref:Uncharacterized protein n=1 Tax=Caerostris darwini TaxID=1538125 RepID=A0AAV4WU79_9ARAC|nr:hypothetical protein CDAR_601381 [Caerostris darwini]
MYIRVYKRCLSKNSGSPFYKDQKPDIHALVFLLLGLVLLGVAVFFYYYPWVETDRTLFLVCLGLSVFFEIVSIIITCSTTKRETFQLIKNRFYQDERETAPLVAEKSYSGFDPGRINSTASIFKYNLPLPTPHRNPNQSFV